MEFKVSRRQIVSKISKLEPPAWGNQLEKCLKDASREETNGDLTKHSQNPEPPIWENRLIHRFRTTLTSKTSLNKLNLIEIRTSKMPNGLNMINRKEGRLETIVTPG